MSTQLILYPQTYNGLPNTISLSPTQKLVDSINFSSINNSSSYDSASSLSSIESSVVSAAPPNIINTWYRYRSTISGTPTLPTRIGNSLVLSATTTSTRSGVYQKLSNLIVGAGYAIAYPYTGGTAGSFTTKVFSGTTQTHQWTDNIPAWGYGSVYRVLFAQSVNNDTVFVSFKATVASDVTIDEMTCVQAGVDPVVFGNYITLPDGQVICDLYQEEDIPLTISIDDFKNVAEQVQSYSKDFNLPATKRNNQIFNNMFEVTRADDGLIFNPYVKTQCVLKQDGFILFQGYLRMLDVQDQEGEISYNVNLYSEVIALADILNERVLAELDFSELQHDYDKTSIKNSWLEGVNEGLPLTNPLPTDSFAYDANSGVNHTQVLKYPFIDWTGQINIADANSATSTNIGCPELTMLGQAFRPSIQLKYLINKIFVNTPFTWTSNFFNSADFDRLFLDYNWGADATNPYGEGEANWKYGSSGPAVWAGFGSYTTLQFNWDVTFGAASGYDAATGIFTANNDGTTYSLNYDINSYCVTGSGYGNAFQIEWYRTGSITQSINPMTFTGVAFDDVKLYSGTLTQTLMAGDTLYCRFKCTVGTATTIQEGQGDQYLEETISGIVSIDVVGSGALSRSDRGQIKQWEFLKGIMTMFNLVSMADGSNPNNILIEPYSDVFIKTTNGGNASSLTLADRSIEYDWTDKVDVSQMKLTPLTDLNKITVFKFAEDDEDAVFNAYRASTSGHLYGSKVFDASGLTVLQGTKEIIPEPFGATVCKPLFDQFSLFVTPAIFARNMDSTNNAYANSPRILYNNGKISTGTTYYIPAQNGKSSENQSNFLQFSHLSDIPTITGTRDFVFESSQLFAPIGASPTNNLFNNYWLPYYAELYNADTRLMTLKVNLTPSDINVFKMTDTVMIKNRSFRVNKIDYKPNDLATVEFILIP